MREKALVNQLSNEMQLAKIAKRWAKEFGELVWGDEARVEMLKTSKARDIAGFLDQGHSRVDVAGKRVVRRYYISDQEGTKAEEEDALEGLIEDANREEDRRMGR